MTIKLTPVDSTAVVGYAYDTGTEQLYVQFMGGRTYIYRDVGSDTYADLCSAPSVGTFINKTIKKGFDYEEISASDVELDSSAGGVITSGWSAGPVAKAPSITELEALFTDLGIDFTKFMEARKILEKMPEALALMDSLTDKVATLSPEELELLDLAVPRKTGLATAIAVEMGSFGMTPATCIAEPRTGTVSRPKKTKSIKAFVDPSGEVVTVAGGGHARKPKAKKDSIWPNPDDASWVIDEEPLDELDMMDTDLSEELNKVLVEKAMAFAKAKAKAKKTVASK